MAQTFLGGRMPPDALSTFCLWSTIAESRVHGTLGSRVLARPEDRPLAPARLAGARAQTLAALVYRTRKPWEGFRTFPRWYVAGRAGQLPTRSCRLRIVSAL